MNSRLVHERVRGIAIGDISRFQGSPIHETVTGLDHCGGPGFELDKATGKLQYAGGRDAYELLKAEIVLEHGLNPEETSTVWDYLRSKRVKWYVDDAQKDGGRDATSHADEAATREIFSIAHNNLTVELGDEGLSLFMAIHYGVREALLTVLKPWYEWMDQKETSNALAELGDLPSLQIGEAPTDLSARWVWAMMIYLEAYTGHLDPRNQECQVRLQGIRALKGAKAMHAGADDLAAAKRMWHAAANVVKDTIG